MTEAEVFRNEIHAALVRPFVDDARENLGPERLARLLGEFGVTSEQFDDQTAWFSLAFMEGLFDRLHDVYRDPTFLPRVGRRALSRRYLGILHPFFRAFGSPLYTFTQVAQSTVRFNKVGGMKLLERRLILAGVGEQLAQAGLRALAQLGHRAVVVGQQRQQAAVVVDRRPVGVGGLGLLSGPAQVLAPLRQVVAVVVVVGQQVDVLVDRRGARPLDIAADLIVQHGPRCERHAFVGHLARQHVPEQVGQLRVGRVLRRQIDPAQRQQVGAHAALVAQLRVGAPQHRGRE